jgi:hypothetical protein
MGEKEPTFPTEDVQVVCADPLCPSPSHQSVKLNIHLCP